MPGRARFPSPTRARVGLGVAVVVSIVVGVLPVTAPVSAASRPGTELHWKPCGDGFSCATLRVPVDERDPASGRIGILVTRRRARDRGARIGTLVVNPGGPGESAVDFLQSQADSLPAELQDRFDLVAFDPRGVGGSAPVECVDSLDPLFAEQFSPADAAQRDALVQAYRTVADGCAAMSGRRLAHVSTRETAHDLDRLRAALGEERIDYLGYSYGTYLGALYAQDFPDRVGRFVLDGPVDPTLDAAGITLSQARGFERALDDFLTWCAGHSSCNFRDSGPPARTYDELRARVARDPVPAADQPGRTLDQTRFDAAVLQMLYGGHSGWRTLDRGLTSTYDGNSSSFLAVADAFEGRGSDGRDDGALEAFWAISCRDGPVVGDVAAVARLEDEAARVAPRLGPFIVNNSLACSVWPQPALPAPGPLTKTGAAPILVVGTTLDPATPYEQAQSLARQLHDAVLLTVRGSRHTSFAAGNGCVDRAVVRYLRSGDLPVAGTRC